MFLIEVSPDELSYLKRKLDEARVMGTEAVMHAELRKRCDQPIIGEKLVADIQQKARASMPGGAPPEVGTPLVPRAPEQPQHPPMPPAADVIPPYPMPAPPPTA